MWCAASRSTSGAGEIVALLGRNGMGKTTFIRSIMGLTPPQIKSGSITWRGENLVGLRPHDIARGKSRSCRKDVGCFRR
ncbi:MAG: ATP-binding cassette domain-containing protein [Bradyrhizobium sp.]